MGSDVSEYTILQDTSLALRELLWANFAPDQQIRQLISSPGAIELTNPAEIRQNDSLRLSLWLYQVTENEFMKNQPPVRLQNGTERRAPMALTLYYLVTPNSTQPEANQIILGRTMQVFYDNPTLVVPPAGAPLAELRIVFARLSLEELTRVWEALKEPYRLSVCYQVRVALIDSGQESGGARVVERTLQMGSSGRTFDRVQAIQEERA